MLATKNRLVPSIGPLRIMGILALAIAFIFVQPTRAQEDAPAKPIEMNPRRWHKYVNHTAGFSIWYLNPYRSVPVPPPNGGDKWRHGHKRDRSIAELKRRNARNLF
jgi:hypothetical protein